MSETNVVIIIFGSLASVLTIVDIFFAYLLYKLASKREAGRVK
jgi:flagellar biogenesis protein FliO